LGKQRLRLAEAATPSISFDRIWGQLTTVEADITEEDIETEDIKLKISKLKMPYKAAQVHGC